MSLVTLPEKSVIEADPKLFLANARALKIESKEEYELAAEDLKAIKKKAKELDEQRKTITKPLDDEKASVMNFYRPATEFLTEAESILKKAMSAYQAEVERQAAIERARQNAIAIAAQQRQREEAAKREAEAQLALAEGDIETAVALQSEAAELELSAELTTPAIVAEPSKTDGISYKTTWTAEVTDIVALCQYIAQNPNQAHLVEPNISELRKLAIALKDQMNIPGVKAVSNRSVSVR